MKRSIWIGLIVPALTLAASTARAGDIFVAPGGLDTNAGTITAPYRTIARAVAVAIGGDVINLRAGTYREPTVNIPATKSGTVSAPTTIRAWRLEAATLSGADPTSGWESTTLNGMSAYVLSSAGLAGMANDHEQVAVYQDDQMLSEARTPNLPNPRDPSHPTWAILQNVNASLWPSDDTMYSADALVIDSRFNIPAGASWKGARMYFLPGGQWGLRRAFYDVQSSSHALGVHSLQFTVQQWYPELASGARFYLAGTKESFDTQGEWYYDRINDRLYIWPLDSVSPMSSPESFTVRRRAVAINVQNGAHDIRIEGIRLLGASIQTENNTQRVNLDRLDANWFQQSSWLLAPLVTWTAPVGCSGAGTSVLTKTATTYGWNAGASSVDRLYSYSGDGWAEVAATTGDKIFGLNGEDSAPTVQDIDFAIYMEGSSNLFYVYEQGSWRYTGGAFAPGDRMRVAVEGGVVKYRRNGVLFYTSTVAPTYPLLVDTSIYTVGASFANLVLSPTFTGAGGDAWLETSGIVMRGTGHRLTNSRLAWSSNNGVIAIGDDHEISNNTITDSDYMGLDNAAVQLVRGSNVRVFGNTLLRSGSLLFTQWLHSQGATFTHNTLKDPCLQTHDCGATYTYVDWNDGAPTEIAYNVIDRSEDTGDAIHIGIYLDNYTAGFYVHHNDITGYFSDGIRLNPASSINRVEYNRMYNIGEREAGTFGISGWGYSGNSADYYGFMDSHACDNIYFIIRGYYEFYGGARGTCEGAPVGTGNSFRYNESGHVNSIPQRDFSSGLWIPGWESVVDVGNCHDCLIAGAGSTSSVTWTSAVGCSGTGTSTLTKTSSAYGWNAGAASVEQLSSGDGYVEAIASTGDKIFGLNHGDSAPTNQDIDFAMYQEGSSHLLYVYEQGIWRASAGSFAFGDRLRVAVEDGVVKYRKNGVLVYTSSAAPIYPLLVDTTLYAVGASFSGLELSGGFAARPVTWTAAVGCSGGGSYTLTKTSTAYGWNAGGVSIEQLTSGDGYAEVVATPGHTIFGLSHGDSAQTVQDIDFAIYMEGSTNQIAVYEQGAWRAYFPGTYAPGDRLRVAVEGGVVKYRKNGVLFYTSSVQPIYPLLVDTSIYDEGSSLVSLSVSAGFHPLVTWTSAVGCSGAGTNVLAKTSSTSGWNAGASSTERLTTGNGYVEATATTGDTIFGLSTGDSTQTVQDIDFAIYMESGTNLLAVYEQGVWRNYPGTYTPGDRLRVAVEGGVVRYRKNGVLFYTSSMQPTYPLVVDTSIYTLGANLTNVDFVWY